MRKVLLLAVSFFLLLMLMVTLIRFCRPALVRQYYTLRLQAQSRNDSDLAFLKVRSNEAIAVLIDLLHGKDPGKTVSALRILGALHITAAADTVLDLFNAPDPDVRDTAVETLVKINTPETIEKARRAVESTRDFNRMAPLLEFLYEAGQRKHIAALLPTVLGWDRDKRQAVVRFVFEEPTRTLLRKLQDRNRYIRGDAILALGLLQNPDTLPFLLDMADNAAFYARIATAYSLCLLAGDKPPADALQTLLQDKTPEVRMAAALSLLLASDRSMAPLLADPAVSDHDADVRWACLYTTLLTSPQTVLPLVQRAMDDSDAGVHGQALLAAGLLGVTSLKKDLADALRETNPTLLMNAIRGSGFLNDPGLTEKIVPLLDASDPKIRACAACALADGTQTLYGQVVIDHLARETDPQVAAALIEAAGSLAPDQIGFKHLDRCRQLFPQSWPILDGLDPRIDQASLFVRLNLAECAEKYGLTGTVAPAAELAGLAGVRDVVRRRGGTGGESAGKLIRLGPQAVFMDIGGGISATIKRENIERIDYSPLFRMLVFLLENAQLRQEADLLKNRRQLTAAYDRLLLVMLRDRLMIVHNPASAALNPMLERQFKADSDALQDFEAQLRNLESITLDGQTITGTSLVQRITHRYAALNQEKQQRARQFERQAQDAERAGRYDQAVDLYRQILLLSPDDMDIKLTLANALERTADYTSAANALQEVLKLQPQRIEVYLRLAEIDRKTYRCDDALAIIKRCQEQTAESARTALDLGLTYRQMGKPPEALRQWQRALELDPTMFAPYFLLACQQTTAGNYMEAMLMLNKGLAVEPNHPAARCLRGLLHLYMGEDKQAISECLEAVILTRNTDADLLVLLAQVFTITGDQERAREFFQKALALRPSDARIQKSLEVLGGG